MSVFQKLRKLSDSNKEDYLTELLAHCLATDPIFWEAFLVLLQVQPGKTSPVLKNPVVETQKFYPKFSPHYQERYPDIEISLPDTVIIIENKIDSGEGDGQLPDYANILNHKRASNKILVYLTVYSDNKAYNFKELGVNFIPLRWQKVGEAITSKCGDFTREMRTYLKNERLMMNKFDYQDLAAINVFFSTADKINSVIVDDINDYFVREKKLGKLNVFVPKIGGKEYGFYYNYRDIAICFGVASWWEDGHPKLIVKAKFMGKTGAQKALSESFFNALQGKGWYWIEPTGSKEFIVEKTRPLYEFLGFDEQRQRQEIIQFYKDCIDEMGAQQANFPQIFGNPTPDTTTIEQQIT